jgi:methylated-DNA-[protein]-cysteine S-methyltransferase
MLSYQFIPSPVGNLMLIASDAGLRALVWQEEEERERIKLGDDIINRSHPILLQTEKELSEYFEGRRKKFSVPLDPIGTDFQKRAWMVLRNIPYGETRTYSQQARSMGQPKAMRAVGAANGRNPISIIVPCHRVIGQSGDLVGFGGGLYRKKKLLLLEGYQNNNLK